MCQALFQAIFHCFKRAEQGIKGPLLEWRATSSKALLVNLKDDKYGEEGRVGGVYR